MPSLPSISYPNKSSIPMTEKPTLTFNSSSKQFLLNWSYAGGTSSGPRDPVLSVLSERGNKFLQKSSHQIAKKVGSPQTMVRTPALSPRITRNERERSTFYIGENQPRSQSTICPPSRTTEEWTKMERMNEAAKVEKVKRKKEEISKLQDEKWSRLKTKLLERQPFRF